MKKTRKNTLKRTLGFVKNHKREKRIQLKKRKTRKKSKKQKKNSIKKRKTRKKSKKQKGKGKGKGTGGGKGFLSQLTGFLKKKPTAEEEKKPTAEEEKKPTAEEEKKAYPLLNKIYKKNYTNPLDYIGLIQKLERDHYNVFLYNFDKKIHPIIKKFLEKNKDNNDVKMYKPFTISQYITGRTIAPKHLKLANKKV